MLVLPFFNLQFVAVPAVVIVPFLPPSRDHLLEIGVLSLPTNPVCEARAISLTILDRLKLTICSALPPRQVLLFGPWWVLCSKVYFVSCFQPACACSRSCVCGFVSVPLPERSLLLCIVVAIVEVGCPTWHITRKSLTGRLLTNGRLTHTILIAIASLSLK